MVVVVANVAVHRVVIKDLERSRGIVGEGLALAGNHRALFARNSPRTAGPGGSRRVALKELEAWDFHGVLEEIIMHKGLKNKMQRAGRDIVS